jgi:hypothetical protein
MYLFYSLVFNDMGCSDLMTVDAVEGLEGKIGAVDRIDI